MQFTSVSITIEAEQFIAAQHRGLDKWGAEARMFWDHLYANNLFDVASDHGLAAWTTICHTNGWDNTIIARVYDTIHQTWVGVKDGQWIIRGTKGEFYPCDDEVFREKYHEGAGAQSISVEPLPTWVRPFVQWLDNWDDPDATFDDENYADFPESLLMMLRAAAREGVILDVPPANKPEEKPTEVVDGEY